jgi:hypothetical protein
LIEIRKLYREKEMRKREETYSLQGKREDMNGTVRER